MRSFWASVRVEGEVARSERRECLRRWSSAVWVWRFWRACAVCAWALASVGEGRREPSGLRKVETMWVYRRANLGLEAWRVGDRGGIMV